MQSAWPFRAITGDVRSQEQSGKHLLAASISPFDPGCVKTCRSQECAELFSLSSSLSSGRKHFWFSNLRNRDGISTRRLNVGVFTRPRPKAEVARAAIKLEDKLGLRSLRRAKQLCVGLNRRVVD